MKVSKLARGWGVVCGLITGGMFLVGCHGGPDRRFAEIPGLTTPQQPVAGAQGGAMATSAPSSQKEFDIIHVGAWLKVTFSDLPYPQPAIEDRVRDDGTIMLIQNLSFVAAEKDRTSLEKEIHDAYVPKYFKTMTVQVTPQVNTQFYYVDGEVKRPDRQVYIGRITVLKAIASANGFTDFAYKSHVLLTRADGKTQSYINCIKAQKDPRLDLEIYPGDRVQVFRKPNPFAR